MAEELKPFNKKPITTELDMGLVDRVLEGRTGIVVHDIARSGIEAGRGSMVFGGGPLKVDFFRGVDVVPGVDPSWIGVRGINITKPVLSTEKWRLCALEVGVAICALNLPPELSGTTIVIAMNPFYKSDFSLVPCCLQIVTGPNETRVLTVHGPAHCSYYPVDALVAFVAVT